MTSSRKKTIVVALKTITIALVLCVLAAELVLRFLPVQTGLHSLPVNAENPVARFEPNRPFVFSDGWDLALANRGRVNNVGFVNRQDYDSTLNTPLLAVVGSDEVEALIVPFDSTVHGRLANLVAGRARVYSFGGSGSSLSQDLSWADYARQTFRPSRLAVILSPSDADHSLLKYWQDKGFYHFREAANGELELQLVEYEPSRIRMLARESALVRYVVMNGHSLFATEVASLTGGIPDDPGESRLRENERAVDAFLEQLPQRAGLPPQQIALVIDAVRPAMYKPQNPETHRSSFEHKVQRYIVDRARQAGFEVIDLEPIFRAQFARDSVRLAFEVDDWWNEVAH